LPLTYASADPRGPQAICAGTADTLRRETTGSRTVLTESELPLAYARRALEGANAAATTPAGAPSGQLIARVALDDTVVTAVAPSALTKAAATTPTAAQNLTATGM
jgi:hypothetical protein